MKQYIRQHRENLKLAIKMECEFSQMHDFFLLFSCLLFPLTPHRCSEYPQTIYSSIKKIILLCFCSVSLVN